MFCLGSNVESYLPLASGGDGPPGGVCSTGDVETLFPLLPDAVAAAAAAARSFFEAFPRFFRSRAYSHVSPNSMGRQHCWRLE